jgi:superoxide dismutase, Fe-Mn family
MSFILPELPFPMDALEPVISKKTLEFHYSKHHQAYVNNLNKLTEGSDLANRSLEELIKSAEGGIFNNAAQVWNHTFYWESITPGGKEIRNSLLKVSIEKYFGSLDFFIEQFTQSSVTLFGSGWAWLVKENGTDKLKIIQGSNAWNPLKEGHIPILTCDVWEHAYYLDYQNRRPEYVKEFWGIVDWEKLEERYEG